MTVEEPKTESDIERDDRLIKYAGPDRIILSPEMRRLIANQGAPPVAFNSGIYSLDYEIEGFEGGEMVVISGPTGNGKTLLAKTLTANFYRQQVGAVWFSYEVTPRQFLRDFGDDVMQFALPLTLAGNSIEWLEERIREAMVKHNVQAVFIDHLHFIIDMLSKHNFSLTVGVIMRQLKQMAKRLGIVIFLLCHIGKANRMNPTTEPVLDDIRDSSFIPQEADTVLFVWRVNADKWPKELAGAGIGSYVKASKARRTGRINNIVAVIKRDAFLIEAEG